MSLRRLKWLAVLAPMFFLGALDVARHALYPALLHAWPGTVLIFGTVLLGTLFFAESIFGVIDRMQVRLAQQNREMLALHEAGLAISGELGLEAVLQKVVDQARELVGSRYGALSLVKEEGGIEAFLTSGLSAEERARIGALPEGRGLLGVVLNEGQRLRLADLPRDPRAAGFPLHHPPMHSLLAVPIITRGRALGNLYLTEKETAQEFSADDEETLVRFATQAALAIENAHLHRQVKELAITEERDRIAREMHDSLAQVLGYVNTKAQAAQELLRSGQPERAAAQIGQLAEAARAAYADVRESILGLRTSLGPDIELLDALNDYLVHWQEQSGVTAELVTTSADGFDPPLPPAAELQLLRIVQEALANVRKHAAASHVLVRLAETEGWVEAVVADDGVGFDPAALGRGAFPRFGLSTMRERAEAVGGRLEIDSAPGRGTRVTVRVPANALAVAMTAMIGGSRARADR
ncbi:MAG: GAF domain-containing sensor histidine kinase [Chloroflexi bacterium]|nr:GAF domain-containing sensor histidine kinase [Chloroflexota bacterium]